MDYIAFAIFMIVIFVTISFYMNKKIRIFDLKDIQMINSYFLLLVPFTIFVIVLIGLIFGNIFVNYETKAQTEKMQNDILTIAENYSFELKEMGHDLIKYNANGQYHFMKERISVWEKAHPEITNIFTFRKFPSGSYFYVITPRTMASRPISLESGMQIGSIYKTKNSQLEKVFSGKEVITKNPIHDVLGNNFMAYVPIFAKNGEVDAVLGIGIKADLWEKEIKMVRYKVLAILSIVFLFLYLIYWLLFRIRLEEIKMKRLAFTDDLTKLPNRRFLKELVAKIAKKGEQFVPFLLLDIDRFKTVNDSLGHLVGDELIQQVGKRLIYCVQNKGIIGRISGDEYIILLNSIRNKKQLQDFIQDMQQMIKKPMFICDHEINITTSIGISIYPYHGQDYESLWKNSDLAISYIKTQGGNGYTFYSEKLGFSLTNNLIIENDLRKALSQKQLEVYYQPRVDIKSGKLNAAEALLRWHHPKRGFISPTEFIPLAEETGLIIPIGEWIIREVCKQIKEWSHQGLKPIPISVNLSAKQFQHKDFITSLKTILQQSKIDPRLLELEITERIAMQNTEEVIDTLSELKMLGMKILMDDFGTGYSSLSFLGRLPIDTLKIAREFVMDIKQKGNNAIITTIISMAHNLNLSVIAEGVESQEQIEILKEMKCYDMQGFFFSKPVPLKDMERLLKKESIGTVV